MKWIKASERIPNDDGNRPVKVNGQYAYGNFFDLDEDKRAFSVNSSCEGYVVYPEYFNQLEWLDESIPSPGGVEEDFQYPTYLEAGGNKEWDSMTELEQANYNLRKALNALAVSKTTIKRLREKQFPQPDKDKEIAELKERVINLQQADMTHQYNIAEAERHWPDIERQIREDERSKQQATIDELRELVQDVAKNGECDYNAIGWHKDSCKKCRAEFILSKTIN